VVHISHTLSAALLQLSLGWPVWLEACTLLHCVAGAAGGGVPQRVGRWLARKGSGLWVHDSTIDISMISSYKTDDLGIWAATAVARAGHSAAGSLQHVHCAWTAACNMI
jgi:hypothetical protein